MGVICGIMKLKTMRSRIRAAEEQADELFAMGAYMTARSKRRPLMRYYLFCFLFTVFSVVAREFNFHLKSGKVIENERK